MIVLCAGLSMRSAFVDFDYENHEYITNVNLNGPIALTKSLVSHFIKNKNGQFVNITSVQSKLTPGLRTSYCGSKHGLFTFFDSLRAEVYN